MAYWLWNFWLEFFLPFLALTLCLPIDGVSIMLRPLQQSNFLIDGPFLVYFFFIFVFSIQLVVNKFFWLIVGFELWISGDRCPPNSWGCGFGVVGRAATYDTRDLQFESQHRQSFQMSVNCKLKKDEHKERLAKIGTFQKMHSKLKFIHIQTSSWPMIISPNQLP